MTRIDKPALRGSWLGRLLRLWNPVYKLLLRSPLHWPWSRIALVLEFSGSKTGRTYATPVHYVNDGSRLLLTSGDRWSQNVKGGAPVGVWLSGQRRVGRATLVEDRQQSVELHRRMISMRPMFGWLMGLRGKAGGEQLERAIRAGRSVVVVELDESAD